jgi:amidase
VPVAKSRGGLPIGLQLTSAPFADRTTLKFAELLESAGLTV